MNDINKLILELKEEGATEKEAEELALLSKNFSNSVNLERSFDAKVKFLKQKHNTNFSYFKRHIFASFLAVVLFIGFSTVVSAQDSLPGQPLYQVKRATEDIVGTINPSFKGQILIRRSNEIKKLSNPDNKNVKNLINTINDFEDELNEKSDINEKEIEESRENLRYASQVATDESRLKIEYVLRQTEKRQEIQKQEDHESDRNEKSEDEDHEDIEF